MIKKLFATSLIFCLTYSSVFAFSDYYIFGLRLQENEPDLVPLIENQFGVKVPVVSLIYDDFGRGEIYKLAKTFKTLGTDRVYHISINPFGHNLLDLINDPKHGGWEEKYRILFRLIKKYKVKVIFRSLHEMNGGWYSWSSDPENFKIFWKMMWDWSREEGLSRANILFDMSVNSQDLPAEDPANIYQGAPVITCSQTKKIEEGCHTFEDYYPGDDYVDLMGVTVYNWGTGARKEEWAKWRDPIVVINEPGYWTFDRLKKMGKPIFIDEAGSTSIKIKGDFDQNRLAELYKESHTSDGITSATGTIVKNRWIGKLSRLYTDPQVLGGAYFNADVTAGLTDRSQIGELDWTAIDPVKNFAYPAIKGLLNSDKNLEFPTFYFDLPDDVLNSRVWPTDDSMFELNDLVSKYMVYKEGNLILNGGYVGTQIYPKYQYYLEKQLQKDPILCKYIKSKFPGIICISENISFEKEKQAIFNLLSKSIETSSIRLSNWGVWEQIEGIKVMIEGKFKDVEPESKGEAVRDVLLKYLNDYEINLLDLR